MKINKDKLLKDILSGLDQMDYVHPDDIPNIGLYMDQVTTFMDTQLAASKRYPDDKILTKTMINNYTKNHLLPPSDKKKYSKEHLLLLIFIYYMKNILCIRDIDTLLNPLTTNYFLSSEKYSLEDIYSEVFQLEKSTIESMEKDILEKFNVSTTTFQDADDKEKDYLQLFTFIAELCFDVYVKKQMIEKIVDMLPEPNHKKK